MSQACSISAGRVYGLQRVSRVWKVARSTVYEQRRRQTVPPAVARVFLAGLILFVMGVVSEADGRCCGPGRQDKR